MPSLAIPSEGLVLQHEVADSSTPSSKTQTQIIRLDLAHDNTRDILKTLRNNEQVRLRFGKKPTIQFGKQFLAFNVGADLFPTDLYTLPENDGGSMYFSGKLSHTLEIRRAQEATANSDHALAALENTLKTIQEQKVSNETSFVRNKDEMKDLNKKSRDNRPSPLYQGQASAIRKDRFLPGITRSTPASPFLGAAFSPRSGPTSAPLLSAGAPSKDKIRLDAIRIPMVHLIASRPMSSKAIAQKLHASQEDCDKVLQKIGRDDKQMSEKKELKDKSYRELDVWKFPYQSEEDRQLAIDHAVLAFDRMRVEKTNNLWQMLLPKDERGKGKHLSKLSFDKPVLTQATPKPDSQSCDGKDGNKTSGSEEERGRQHVKARDPKARATSHEPVHRKKASEKESISKQHVRKEAIKQLKDIHHERDQTKQKQANSHSRFKSSEFVEDSDEEAENVAKDVVAKPITPTGRGREGALHNAPQSRRNSPKPHSRPPNKPFHKSKLSDSSSSKHKSKLLGSSIVEPLANDKRSNASDDPTKLMARPRAESSLSRLSPRPRTGSSPQKPSPLASSPPTNSSDLDNSSSSKDSSRSSVTSSPPSSTDMPEKRPKNFSPILSEKRGTPARGRSPAKRKAEDDDNLQPSKRHQVNGVHLKPLPSDLTDSIQRPAVKRLPSDSDSLSSPEKPEQRTEEVLDKSKRFQLYYKRYKDMYDKVSGSKDKQEIDEFLKMHQRLSELKQEIWDDWRKLGEPEKIEI